jgi:Gpi18-like mannosyltransferase
MLAKPLFGIFLFLLAVDFAVIKIFWHQTNLDLIDWLLPWYEFLRQNGVTAFATNFSNYTPPYLYFLGLGTLLDGVMQPSTIIRGISVTFNAAAAILVFRFALKRGLSLGIGLYAAVMFLLLPSIIVNSAIWGQCDIIYTLFLMLFVYFVIERRGWAATTALGVAFAFKQQAAFIAPFALYLLMSQQLRWRQFVMVPFAYLVLMMPSAIAGRPWVELLTIYANQFDTFRTVSMGAPNPYLLLQKLVELFPSLYAPITITGLTFGVASVIGLAVVFVRRTAEPNAERLLLMATLSLAAVPYLLPRMHDRYFFPAGAMAFLLVLVRPRSWPILLLMQLAELCAYVGFLVPETSNIWQHIWSALSGVLMTAAIVWLVGLLFDWPVLNSAILLPPGKNCGVVLPRLATERK